MGFSYATGYNGKNYLMCDFCGKSKLNDTTIRKIRCPFRWCQAYATCTDCKKINTKELHIKSDCDLYIRESNIMQEFKERRLKSDLFVNVCDEGLDDGTVKATFRNKDGLEIVRIVTHGEYKREHSLRYGWFIEKTDTDQIHDTHTTKELILK